MGSADIGMAFIVVFVLVLLVGIVFGLGYLVYFWLSNRFSPLVRVAAKVVRKRHNQKDYSLGGESLFSLQVLENLINGLRGHSTPEVLATQSAECFLTFKSADRELELRVPTQLYIDTQEGDEGLLVYQGELFRKFIPGVTRNLR